jgi:hypothetical protein
MPNVGPAPATVIVPPTDAEEGQTRTVRNPAGGQVLTVGKSSSITTGASDAFTIAAGAEERITLEMGEALYGVIPNGQPAQPVDVL